MIPEIINELTRISELKFSPSLHVAKEVENLLKRIKSAPDKKKLASPDTLVEAVAVKETIVNEKLETFKQAMVEYDKSGKFKNSEEPAMYIPNVSTKVKTSKATDIEQPNKNNVTFGGS